MKSWEGFMDGIAPCLKILNENISVLELHPFYSSQPHPRQAWSPLMLWKFKNKLLSVITYCNLLPNKLIDCSYQLCKCLPPWVTVWRYIQSFYPREEFYLKWQQVFKVFFCEGNWELDKRTRFWMLPLFSAFVFISCKLVWCFHILSSFIIYFNFLPKFPVQSFNCMILFFN